MFMKVHSSLDGEPMLIRRDLIFKITNKEDGCFIEFTNGESEYVTETFAVIQKLLTQPY